MKCLLLFFWSVLYIWHATHLADASIPNLRSLTLCSLNTFLKGNPARDAGARLTRRSQPASTDRNTENEGQFGGFFREEAVVVFAHAKAFVCVYCVRHQFQKKRFCFFFLLVPSLICVLGNVNILPVRVCVCVACQRVCVRTLVNL